MKNDNKQLIAETVAAMFSDKRGIEEVMIDNAKMMLLDGPLEYAAQYESFVANAAKNSAFQTDFVKSVVDGMLQSSVDMQNLPGTSFAYAIPTTPEEFKAYYAQEAKRGMNAKRMVERSATAFADKTMLEAKAHILATRFKFTTMPIARELAARGIDPSHFVAESARLLLRPAQIDSAKLDPSLSANEKAYVQQHAELARLYSEKSLLDETPRMPALAKKK